MPANEQENQRRPASRGVREREEVADGIRIRRRLTQQRAAGGEVVFLLFLGCLAAVVFVIIMPEVRPIAEAVGLVFALRFIMMVLNMQYEREVSARVEAAKEQFRQMQAQRVRAQREQEAASGTT